MARPKEFGQLLTEAVRHIELRESKSIQIVQDELGYALDRESGGSAIEYWRKGHVPAKRFDVERLARIIAERTKLGRDWLLRFLRCAGHDEPEPLLDEIAPLTEMPRVRPESFPQPTRTSGAFVRELAPFVVGPPISDCRQFFGREQELKRIFATLSRFPLQHTAIIGRHRSGKTSLLHYVKNCCSAITDSAPAERRTQWLAKPEQYRFIFVDFQDARMSRQETLLRYLLAELEIAAPEMCDLPTFIDTVSRNLRGPTVILMDEIDAALESPDLDLRFWWGLRSLSTNSAGGQLGFVIASHESPDLQARAVGKPSPFFNIFRRLDLGPLTEAAARELIASSPHPFSPADTEWILEQSGCWPALAQIFCNTLLLALEAGETGDTWVTEALYQAEPYRYLLQ